MYIDTLVVQFLTSSISFTSTLFYDRQDNLYTYKIN